jgi:hypothetical protein
MNTKPLLADPVVAPDPIAEAAVQVRRKFEQDKKAHYAAELQSASDAWVEHEHTRREKFIRNRMLDNYIPLEYPYEDYSREDLYRISRPPETRIEDLLKLGLYVQGLTCFLVRNGGRSDIPTVQRLLEPYIPVTGNVDIEPTDAQVESMKNGGHELMQSHAQGLSRELADVLTSNEIKVLWGTVKLAYTPIGDTSEW